MTFRAVLRERALDQHGYVTTDDAAALGVPPVELRKLAARGGFENVAYGLYRLADAPVTPLDQYAEAVLRVGPDAYLTHDSVLAVHNLALVNPSNIRVGTPHRTRGELPAHIVVIRQSVPDNDLTAHEGIRTTTVARAILDCRGLIMDERLLQALKQSEREGLIPRRQVSPVRSAILHRGDAA